MLRTIGICVFDNGRQLWLSEDEKTWTRDYDDAQVWTPGNEQLAHDIGLRALPEDGGQVRVMAILA